MSSLNTGISVLLPVSSSQPPPLKAHFLQPHKQSRWASVKQTAAALALADLVMDISCVSAWFFPLLRWSHSDFNSRPQSCTLNAGVSDICQSAVTTVCCLCYRSVWYKLNHQPAPCLPPESSVCRESTTLSHRSEMCCSLLVKSRLLLLSDGGKTHEHLFSFYFIYIAPVTVISHRRPYVELHKPTSRPALCWENTVLRGL